MVRGTVCHRYGAAPYGLRLPELLDRGADGPFCRSGYVHGRRGYSGPLGRPAPAREFPNGIIQGFLPYWPGEVVVVGLRDGAEVCRDTVVTPGQAVRLRFEEEETAITMRRDDAGRVLPFQLLCKVRACDTDGNAVFHEYDHVRFTVEGPRRSSVPTTAICSGPNPPRLRIGRQPPGSPQCPWPCRHQRHRIKGAGARFLGLFPIQRDGI